MQTKKNGAIIHSDTILKTQVINFLEYRLLPELLSKNLQTCLGLEQITLTTLRRRIIWHLAQIFLTEDLTFIVALRETPAGSPLARRKPLFGHAGALPVVPSSASPFLGLYLNL